MTTPHPSLLSQLLTLITVDLDSMDPAAALRHAPLTFTDMTSNQAIVYNQATQPENKRLIQDSIDYVRALYPDSARDPAEYLREVVDVVTARMAKLVFPHLKGKVHAQTSPAFAYDTEKTIAHAKRLVAIFEAHGIPRSRICIKIPATPESMTACRALSSPPPNSGDVPIHTLATCVFSIPQALAAVQAGCTYVAPYFNELRVHFDSSSWREYNDTAVQHPMSSIIASIIATLEGTDTLVMPASIVTIPEVIALATLRPDHLTVSAPLLDKLANTPVVTDAEIAPRDSKHASKSTVGIDYLAAEGVHLKEAFIREPDISRRVIDALGLFAACERRSMEFVRSGIVDVEWDGVSGY